MLYFLDASTFSKVMTIIGILMVVIGHCFRIGSMFYAGSNFNHLVQTKKAVGHTLVKTGPYRFSRHPSYFGWTIWAIGTQLVLSNFICAILWYFAAYAFF